MDRHANPERCRIGGVWRSAHALLSLVQHACEQRSSGRTQPQTPCGHLARLETARANARQGRGAAARQRFSLSSATQGRGGSVLVAVRTSRA
eukprot:COSAG04_NODE_20010_length_402_cov_10.960396_1_plen_91_part_01